MRIISIADTTHGKGRVFAVGDAVNAVSPARPAADEISAGLWPAARERALSLVLRRRTEGPTRRSEADDSSVRRGEGLVLVSLVQIVSHLKLREKYDCG